MRGWSQRPQTSSCAVGTLFEIKRNGSQERVRWIAARVTGECRLRYGPEVVEELELPQGIDTAADPQRPGNEICVASTMERSETVCADEGRYVQAVKIKSRVLEKPQ